MGRRGAGLEGQATVNPDAADAADAAQGAAGAAGAAGDRWPDLTLAGWEDTRDTLLLWTQVVGKVRLALEPMVNQWWQVTLYVSARGLTTSLMHGPTGGLEIEFDFIDHVLHLRTSGGERRQVKLEPRTVASFYAEVMGTLADLGIRPRNPGPASRGPGVRPLRRGQRT